MPRDRTEDDARALRDAVHELRRPSATTAIPRALRARIVAFAARAAAAGWSGATVAQAVGVSIGSIRNWAHASRGVALVPVRITTGPPAAPAPAPAALSVVTPTGYRIEGLDVPTAVAVLRALG